MSKCCRKESIYHTAQVCSGSSENFRGSSYQRHAVIHILLTTLCRVSLPEIPTHTHTLQFTYPVQFILSAGLQRHFPVIFAIIKQLQPSHTKGDMKRCGILHCCNPCSEINHQPTWNSC